MRDVRLGATSPIAFWARFGASLVSGAPFVYSLIQAVRGAKGHTSVLAAEISPHTSTGCAEPWQRKRLLPASSQLKQWKLRKPLIELEDLSDIWVIG
jgi:hypothetical protein